jgi:hypothetical protein
MVIMSASTVPSLKNELMILAPPSTIKELIPEPRKTWSIEAMDMRGLDGSSFDIPSDGGISMILAPAASNANLRCWPSGGFVGEEEHMIHGRLPVPFL